MGVGMGMQLHGLCPKYVYITMAEVQPAPMKQKSYDRSNGKQCAEG